MLMAYLVIDNHLNPKNILYTLFDRGGPLFILRDNLISVSSSVLSIFKEGGVYNAWNMLVFSLVLWRPIHVDG